MLNWLERLLGSKASPLQVPHDLTGQCAFCGTEKPRGEMIPFAAKYFCDENCMADWNAENLH